MISIVLRPQAIVDLRAAKRYYEEQQAGLGEEFRTALDIAFERLQAFPRSAPPVAGVPGIRRALVTRFPYAIFYFATPKEIVVLRIQHTAQNPPDGAAVAKRASIPNA